MIKYFNNRELVEAAASNGIELSNVCVIYHMTKEVEDFTEIHEGMCAEDCKQKEFKFDYAYMFNDFLLTNNFLNDQESVIRDFSEYAEDSDELYSVEEFVGVILNIDYDEWNDKFNIAVKEIIGTSNMEIEVWKDFEELKNACERFDNGKDAAEATKRLTEEGYDCVTIDF